MKHSHNAHRDSTWALVPVKRLSNAKSRLASALSARQRADLQMAMLADVLSALVQSKSLRGVAVVTRDVAVAEFARDHNCSVIEESPLCNCLNAALSDGLVRLREAGAALALIVPADIPLIEAAEIDDVVALGRLRMTLVVPSHDLTGTNGLLVHLDDFPKLAFGQDSFRKHLNSSGRSAMQVSAPAFGLDIDTRDDLFEAKRMFCGRAQRGVIASRTASWMQAHLIIEEKC